MSPQLRVTCLATAGLLFTGIAAAATVPYAAIVAIEGLGISNAGYSLILTVSSIVGVLSSVLLGWFSDRASDRRLLIVAAAALSVIGQVWIWLVHAPWAYIVATCGIMALGGGLTSQILAYARAYLDAQGGRAEFTMTLIRSAYSASWVIGPPLAGWIAATYSVFDAFGLAALAFAVCLALFFVLLRMPDAEVPPARRDPTVEQPARSIAPHMLIGIIGVIALNTAQRLNGLATPLSIVNHWGGNLGDVGIYASLAALFEIPFMIGWGFIVRRMPVPLAIAMATGLYAIYLTLVGNISSVGELFWLQVLNGLAISALLSLPISYMQDAIRGRVGLSTSLLDVVFVASGLIAAGIFAVATDERHYLTIFAIGSWIAWGGMAVMALAWWLRRAATSR